MGSIVDAINVAFRDYVTDGIPATGPNEPAKADIRAIGPVIEQFLSAAGISSSIYETTSDGIAATTNGELFLVEGDGTISFADLYKNVSGTAVDQNVSLPSVGYIEANYQTRTDSTQALSDLLIVEDTFIMGGDGVYELLSPDALRVKIGATTQDQAVSASSFGTGDVFSALTDGGSQAFDGAAVSGPMFITIPNGQIGKGSYARMNWPFAGSAAAGQTVRFKMEIATSAVFTRLMVYQMSVHTATTPYVDRASTINVEVDGSQIFVSFDYLVQGDETAIQAFAMDNLASTVPTGSIEFFRIVGFTSTVIDTPLQLLTVGDENAEQLRNIILSQTILRPAYAETITVRPSGGDFTTLSAAIAAITDSSPSKQYKVAWQAGATIGTPDFHVPAWTSIICQNPRDDAVMSFANPNNASAATIENTSLLWLEADGCVIEGGTWRITNGRYVFHWETNGLFPNTEQRLINVVAQHLGNAAAVNNTWAPFSQYAAGCGVSEGQIQRVVDCDLSGVGGGFSSHSPNLGQPWSTPFRIYLQDSRFRATDPAYKDVLLKPIAVGPGLATLRGCSYDELGYYSGEWIGGDPGSGVNCAQIGVSGSGNANLAGSGKPTFFNAVYFGNSTGQTYVPLFTGV